MSFVITVGSSPNYFLTSVPKHHPLLVVLYHVGNFFFSLFCSFILLCHLFSDLKVSSFLFYLPQFKLSLGSICGNASITVDMDMTQRFISPTLILICETLFIFNSLYMIYSLKHILNFIDLSEMRPPLPTLDHSLKLFLFCLLFNECYYHLSSCKTGALLLFFSSFPLLYTSFNTLTLD